MYREVIGNDDLRIQKAHQIIPSKSQTVMIKLIFLYFAVCVMV